MMREIRKLIIHCSDTPDQNDYTAADIDRWHKENGWEKIGYQWVIMKLGELQQGRLDKEVGAHCKGHNIDSIGICVIMRDEITTIHDLSVNRQIKYLMHLSVIAQHYKKSFTEINKKDILNLKKWLKDTYTGGTPRDYLIIFRIFMKWVRQQEGKKYKKHEYPEEFDDITIKNGSNKRHLPKQLLTMDEILKLADNTTNLRDRAIIMTLYETGARIGELMGLTIKDIDFGRELSHVEIPEEGKTGSRRIPIRLCQTSIANWLQEHPDRENPNAPLFCGLWSKRRGQSINYRTIYEMLRDTFKRANIKKPFNPHHFRHSRATELAKHLTEARLCQHMGWIIGSKEARTYVHLSGKDLDSGYRKMYGLPVDEQEEKVGGRVCLIRRLLQARGPSLPEFGTGL